MCARCAHPNCPLAGGARSFTGVPCARRRRKGCFSASAPARAPHFAMTSCRGVWIVAPSRARSHGGYPHPTLRTLSGACVGLCMVAHSRALASARSLPQFHCCYQQILHNPAKLHIFKSLCSPRRLFSVGRASGQRTECATIVAQCKRPSGRAALGKAAP